MVNHHLTEEELTILNPAREEVGEQVRAELGEAFATERNPQLDADCGSHRQRPPHRRRRPRRKACSTTTRTRTTDERGPAGGTRGRRRDAGALRGLPRRVAGQPVGPRPPGLSRSGRGSAARSSRSSAPTAVGVKAGATREVADEWLERYPDDARVMAYIGRSGWNDLAFGGAIPDDELVEAVEESYRLVVARLPRRDRPEGWEAVSGGAASSSARPCGTRPSRCRRRRPSSRPSRSSAPARRRRRCRRGRRW